MEELGHKGGSIPFIAIYRGDGQPTIKLDGPVLQSTVSDAIERAGPSLESFKKTAIVKNDPVHLPWTTFKGENLLDLSAEIERLRADGRTILIDFTADW